MHGEFRENNGGQGFPLSFSGVSGALLGRRRTTKSAVRPRSP
jgi:hypothetical protein